MCVCVCVCNWFVLFYYFCVSVCVSGCVFWTKHTFPTISTSIFHIPWGAAAPLEIGQNWCYDSLFFSLRLCVSLSLSLCPSLSQTERDRESDRERGGRERDRERERDFFPGGALPPLKYVKNSVMTLSFFCLRLCVVLSDSQIERERESDTER